MERALPEKDLGSPIRAGVVLAQAPSQQAHVTGLTLHPVFQHNHVPERNTLSCFMVLTSGKLGYGGFQFFLKLYFLS
jgi:hypothetical protein